MAHDAHSGARETSPPVAPRAGGGAAAQGVGEGRAHAKVILLGEHAVVYGAPAVALPVPGLGCRVRVARRDRDGHGLLGFRFTPVPPGVPSGSPARLPRTPEGVIPEGLRILSEAVLRLTGPRIAPGVDVHVESGVPLGRGLGSSAACARALVHALDDLFELGLGEDVVFRYVQMAENTAHGRASGIDAWTTGANGPVLLADGRISTPPVGADCWIVVVDSGTGASTREAVGMLRERFAKDPGRRDAFLAHSTALARRALFDLEHGRLRELGSALTDSHTLLAGLDLTTDRTDSLVDASIRVGALGAKMSGGGLGGCVIALLPDRTAADTAAARLTREHGVRCWITPLPKGDGNVDV
ncbi:mevalonate kinase [Embleya scabrispora]|nr:mevalonate kinase [Embleya scabrispora]